MIETANALVQIVLFVLLVAAIYAVSQIASVIREERERLEWQRIKQKFARTGDNKDQR